MANICEKKLWLFGSVATLENLQSSETQGWEPVSWGASGAALSKKITASGSAPEGAAASTTTRTRRPCAAPGSKRAAPLP